MFPTPKVQTGDYSYSGGNHDKPVWNLQGAVKTNASMPTPTANRRSGLQSHGTNVLAGSLNPEFVEWLQGFPIGWTAFDPLETQSFQRWRRSHGEL